MKKQIFMILISSSCAYAKVSDFNHLINENMSVQSQLQAELKVKSPELKSSTGNKRELILVQNNDNFNVKSNRRLFQFKRNINTIVFLKRNKCRELPTNLNLWIGNCKNAENGVSSYNFNLSIHSNQ